MTTVWISNVIMSFKKYANNNALNGNEHDILSDHNIGSNDEMSDFFSSDSESYEDFVGLKPN